MTNSMSDDIAFLVFDAANREIGYLTYWDKEQYPDIYDFWICAPDFPTDLLQVDAVSLKEVSALFTVSPK